MIYFIITYEHEIFIQLASSSTKTNPLNSQRCTLLTSYKTYSPIHLKIFQSEPFDPILMAKPKQSNST
jgi:hypothetical protein